MDLLTVCSFAFCTNLLNNYEFYNYGIELDLESLGYQTDVNHQRMKYLLKVTNFNVKLKVEDEIRKALVQSGHAALHKLHGQASTPLAQEKDSNGTCYWDNKQQIVDAVRSAFFRLEPCISDLEVAYVDLSSKTQSAKANAESLVAEVERIRNLCSGVSEETHQECYDIGIHELGKLIKDSEDGHEELYVSYYNTVELVPAALECVHQGSVQLNQELDNIVQGASNCYAQVGAA